MLSWVVWGNACVPITPLARRDAIVLLVLEWLRQVCCSRLSSIRLTEKKLAARTKAWRAGFPDFTSAGGAKLRLFVWNVVAHDQDARYRGDAGAES